MAGGQEDPKHAEVDFTISCMECHAEVTPDVYEQWRESKHGIMNYGCYMCHGDGVEEFTAKPGMDGCNGCHADQIMKLESKESDSGKQTCYSCHEVHSLKRDK